MGTRSLSLIIPVYNEEQSIGYVLTDTLQHLPKIISNFEIIVVNDGSIDQTRQIVNNYTKKSKRVHLINQHHKGFSYAIVKGIKAAKKEYVAYMQGDGQDLVRDMVNCFRIMHKYDLVLGIRGKRIDYDLYRLLLSYGGMLIYRLLFNIGYEDVHWVYVWKTKEVQKLKLNPDAGMFTLVESLIKFREKGLKIGEATAPYRPRYAGVSKGTHPETVSHTLGHIFRFWWRQHV